MRWLWAALVAVPFTASGGIVDTKHNLSASGTGTVRAVSEPILCEVCHSPHDVFMSRLLWNQRQTTAPFTPYSSATLQSVPPTPDGASKLCISCHDATVPIGLLDDFNGDAGQVPMQGTDDGGVMPAGPARLTPDGRNDHPVSVPYTPALATADGELAPPASLTGVTLRVGLGTTRDTVQCSSCHEPHGTTFSKYLRVTASEGQLCTRCHAKPGWTGSSHQASLILWPQGGTRTVRDWACFACHQPHNAPDGAPRLLIDGASAGAPDTRRTCFRCHTSVADGGVAPDLSSPLARTSRHPVQTPAPHEPQWTVAPPPEAPLVTVKHVTCPDCHNPHRLRPGNVHDGVRGVDIDGGVADDVGADRDLAQYEVCFRCHGDSYATAIGATTASGLPTSNKRLELQPTNNSYHPVAAPGRNTSSNLSQQLAPNGLSTASTIACSDCHNNDATENTAGRASNYGGLEALGPHGSRYPAILRAPYVSALLGSGTESVAAVQAEQKLCLRCHDAARLLARRDSDTPPARTNFYDSINGRDNLHWVHLVDRASNSRAVCKNCHDNPHGNNAALNTQYAINGVVYDFDPGTAAAPPPASVPLRLISFSPDLTPTGGRAKPEWWFNTTTRERRCSVTCHGTTMSALQYRPASGDLP